MHSAQGFARRESTVSFGTLLEYGYADVFCHRGPFQSDKAYERVIAVPFLVCTGKLMVDGPEEINVGRTLELPVGNYRVVCAQRVVDDETELIEIFFEKVDEPLRKSEVIIADAILDPCVELLETAEVA
ncbi:MAG: competence protein ComJ [Chloroflexi bacterium]|nr:competence protein ComJ [Chloroflexota bacterium]